MGNPVAINNQAAITPQINPPVIGMSTKQKCLLISAIAVAILVNTACAVFCPLALFAAIPLSGIGLYALYKHIMYTVNGIDVHQGDREDKTIIGIFKLRAFVGRLNQAQVEKAYTDCIKYIQTHEKIKDQDKALALHALCGKYHQGYDGPLVTDYPLWLCGHLICGKTLTAQLWIFASGIKEEKEKDNARFAIFAALKDCYEANGKRICNRGKTQRLIVGVLPGRLRDVNIENHDIGIVKPTLQEAQRLFFNEERQRITSFRILMEQAEIFLRENPLVDRKEFLEALNDEDFKFTQGYTD